MSRKISIKTAKIFLKNSNFTQKTIIFQAVFTQVNAPHQV